MTKQLKAAKATLAVCGQSVQSSILNAANHAEREETKTHLLVTADTYKIHNREIMDLLEAAEEEPNTKEQQQNNEYQPNAPRMENRYQVA